MSQTIECPHCDHGTVTRETGPLWWQRQALRCPYCRGVGRIAAEPVRV